MDFHTAAKYASILSKDYAEDIFALLVNDQAISASEVAARLNLQGMNTIISRNMDLRDTGDAYLANTTRFFVTQPRFIDNPVVLQRGVNTQAIRRCLNQESGVLETADYRNVPAFIVYRWLPQRSMCLVIKLDKTEVFRPIRAFGVRITSLKSLMHQ